MSSSRMARKLRPRCEPSRRRLQQRQHDHHDEAEPVDRYRADQLIAEQRQRRDAGDADRAAGDALPVQDHQRDDLADRERRDRDVVPAQPERRRDQDRAERGTHQAAADDGEADRDGESQRQQRGGIGADREQRGVPERDLADRAGNQGEAEREHAEQPGVDQGLEHVEGHRQQRQDREDAGRDQQRPARNAHRAARRDERAGQRLGRRLPCAGEQAVRPQHEHDDQQQEREQIAVAGAEHGDAVALDQSEQQAADHRAGHIAGAADDFGDDALERRLQAHRGVDLVVVHADQQAGDAAKRSRNAEHRLIDAVDVDAHLHRGVAVLRGGADGPAELAVAQEHEQQQRAGDADASDQQIERADRAAADLESHIRQLARQRARIGREGQHHQLVEHEADADRRQQRRDAHRVLQRTQAEPLDDQPDQRRRHRDHDDGERHTDTLLPFYEGVEAPALDTNQTFLDMKLDFKDELTYFVGIPASETRSPLTPSPAITPYHTVDRISHTRSCSGQGSNAAIDLHLSVGGHQA